MILTCPACSTRYTVDPASLGREGRVVRCAKCAHRWMQRPEFDLPKVVDVEMTEPHYTTYPEEAPEEPEEEAPPEEEVTESRQGPSVAARWMMLALVVGALIVVALIGRTPIVGLWQPAARLYDTIGLPVEHLGAGLQLQDVRTEQRLEDGVPVLVIEGLITNVSNRPRDVPTVRAISLGPNRKPLRSWLIAVSPITLQPGEVAGFKAAHRDPGTVSEVAITFDSGG